MTGLAAAAAASMTPDWRRRFYIVPAPSHLCLLLSAASSLLAFAAVVGSFLRHPGSLADSGKRRSSHRSAVINTTTVDNLVYVCSCLGGGLLKTVLSLTRLSGCISKRFKLTVSIFLLFFFYVTAAEGGCENGPK